MSLGWPKLLLVANPEASLEVQSLLEAAGKPTPMMGEGGDATLERFQSEAPDAVVMVLGLRKGDAAALCRALKSGHYGPKVPLLVITESETPRLFSESLECDEWMVMPTKGSELVSRIETMCKSASGQKLDAAMEEAIDSFVTEAIAGLDSTGVGQLPAGLSPSEPPPVPRDAAPAKRRKRLSTGELLVLPKEIRASEPATTREATAVLGASPQAWDSQETVNGGETGRSADSQETLGQESKSKKTVKNQKRNKKGPPPPPTPTRPSVPPAPGEASDFASQLRERMAAMAVRLFPDRAASQSDVAQRNPAGFDDSDIDLDEISVEPVVGEGTGPGAGSYPGTAASSEHTVVARKCSLEKSGQGAIDASTSDVVSVIATHWRRSFTGRLIVHGEDTTKTLFFDSGRIVFSSSRTSEDRMGSLLMRAGKIDQEQLEASRREVRRTGRRLGELLVESGYLKARELMPSVRQHLEDIVYSIFSWSKGEYESLQEESPSERIRLSRHPLALLMEGVRRKYSVQRLARCLDAERDCLVLDRGARIEEFVENAELTGEEKRLVSAIDGKRTLTMLCRESGVSELVAAQVGHVLIQTGFATLDTTKRRKSSDEQEVQGPLIGETDLEIDRKRIRARLKLVEESDYFQLLGVRRDASAFEIRRAYEGAMRYLLKESFPPELQEELGDAIDEIAEVTGEAYRVLRNDGIRESYRRELP